MTPERGSILGGVMWPPGGIVAGPWSLGVLVVVRVTVVGWLVVWVPVVGGLVVRVMVVRVPVLPVWLWTPLPIWI